MRMARSSCHRPAVKHVLTHAHGPLSAEEVHQALRDTGIGIATVYRLLKQGMKEGCYTAVEMPHGPTRYEPANRPHHHHFECLTCLRVYDITGCPGHLDRLVPEGFALESHDLLLQGRCASCMDTFAA